MDEAESRANDERARTDGDADVSTPDAADAQWIEEPVSVVVIPPALAEGTPAQARQAALAEASRNDRDTLPALASELPWLAPDAPFACGYYLRTDGLHALTGAPELELINVPGAFVRAAADLLKQLARYVLTSGSMLEDGQVLALDGSRAMVLVKAAPAGEGAADLPLLRLLLLA